MLASTITVGGVGLVRWARAKPATGVCSIAASWNTVASAAPVHTDGAGWSHTKSDWGWTRRKALRASDCPVTGAWLTFIPRSVAAASIAAQYGSPGSFARSTPRRLSPGRSVARRSSTRPGATRPSTWARVDASRTPASDTSTHAPGMPANSRAAARPALSPTASTNPTVTSRSWSAMAAAPSVSSERS